MLRHLISLVAVLALASAVSAATISVDTDKATYLPTEIITVTLTLTTTGAEPVSIQTLLELSWDDPRVAGVPGPNMQSAALTSGGIPWFVGAGFCLSASCLILDQLSPFLPAGAVPDAAVITTTTAFVADTVGDLNFAFETTILFGATPTMGANMAVAKIVPEPATAALLGLGLTGMALARRRRL